LGAFALCGFRLQAEGIRDTCLKILSAEFVTSAAAGGRDDGIPRDGRVQIALAGRSNVGKSTLINALCRQKIARTSAAPGKTRLANIYRVTLDGGVGPGRWDVYLVDLPGYGYARGGAESAQELAAVAEAYFSAAAPEGTLLLVDARHPGLAADTHAHEWLVRVGTSPRIIGTKVDKLSRSERRATQGTAERVRTPHCQSRQPRRDWMTCETDRRPQTNVEQRHRRTQNKATEEHRTTQSNPESGNADKTEEKR
jgi:GTP-binding protein